MATSRIKFNEAEFRRILKSNEVAAALDGPANEQLARMQGNCPVASGDLKASLEVWEETTDRVVKRVGSRSVAYAAAVEANTGFMSRSL